jgi:type VI secretion system secreted protein VgrG
MISIKTALPDADILGLRSFTCQEQISRMFQIEAELSSEKGDINFDDVVGNTASIRLNIEKGNKRYFNGHVSRFVQVANKGGFSHYRATIVPWLWFLTRTSDCRIFQKKKVPDIIEEVFKGRGFTSKDYSLKLSGTYLPKEYCVQYRETDFNFVSRLMEQEGIYYYFDHTSDGKCNLVLADSKSAHKPFPNYDEVTFREVDKGTSDREVITDWTMEKEAQPVATALNDFDFTKPKTSLLAKHKVSRKYGRAEYEIYDYPGDYEDHGDGDRLATVRLDELQSQYEVLHGQASARGLAAGSTFKLKNHPRADQNREYLITSVSIQADAGEFASVGDSSGADFFSCTFTCVDKNQQFRPARLTPKPVVQGPQTAKVVGPSGEKIHTDSFGRVKVQFHWDRYAKGDDNSSCWIRSAQPWGGKGWGGLFIPHVGQEVVVEFMEGDPDRPLITGRVYNADQMPPIVLPDGKNQSAIRDHGGNSINFEGTGGQQAINICCPTNTSAIQIGKPGPTDHPGPDGQSGGNRHAGPPGTPKPPKEAGGADSSDKPPGGHEVGEPSVHVSSLGDLWTQVKQKYNKWENEYTYNTGWENSIVLGFSSEEVGAKIEVCVANKSELIGASLLEIVAGKLIEIRKFKAIEITPEHKELHKDLTEIHNHHKELSKTVDENIKTLNQTIGDMKADIDAVEETVKNAFKLIAGKLDLESKGDIIVQADGDMKVKCGKFQINFSTFDGNSGTFKVMN